MKPFSRSMALLAVFALFIGCGGGGGAAQSQATGTPSSLNAPWFDPASNIIANGGFEAVSQCYTSLLCPDD